MDLSTRYLGFDLPHPLIPGASPLTENLDTIRRLEDAGAAAIVLRSLYEEQIIQDRMSMLRADEEAANSFAEALSYFPHQEELGLGPESYLELIARIKACVRIPVIASLNGVTAAGWTDHAKLIQDAGADALEINVYRLAADPSDTPQAIEDGVVAISKAVKQAVSIPVALKLSPFYSALPHLAQRLEKEAGVDGMVLFNRFLQPDIDIDALEVSASVQLSTAAELRLRLRWIAILSGRINGSLGLSGGIHAVEDVIKAIMVGAHGVQMVSALLRHGPSLLGTLRTALAEWLELKEYDSLRQMQGSMNLMKCPSPANFERVGYLRALRRWREG